MERTKTRPSSIIKVIICTLIISVAQVLYKIGSARLSFDLYSIVTNVPIIAGLFLYFIGALLLVWALKKGDLSILYPFLALSYVWVPLFSMLLLPVPERMNVLKWSGVLVIIAGVSLIGVGSSVEENVQD
ncbi:MAG: EamA family transporter [Candidatus Xenobiia bacterium LiM19]